MSDRSGCIGVSLSDWLRRGAGAGGERPAPGCRVAVEQLEGRLVPSAAPTLDLTSSGAIGSVNGAIFQQSGQQPTGSGVIHSFVRLQAHGAHQTVE